MNIYNFLNFIQRILIKSIGLASSIPVVGITVLILKVCLTAYFVFSIIFKPSLLNRSKYKTKVSDLIDFKLEYLFKTEVRDVLLKELKNLLWNQK